MSDQKPLFGGVNAAVLTPQKDDLSPNLGAMVTHCQWLLDNGCDGLGILGTTGEANSFSVGERIDIIEAVVNGGIAADRIMPGTGCCSITETVELTKAALAVGAGGVLMLPPFYYKNMSDDGLFAYFAEVIERIGDAKLKVFVYHFPQMSAVPFSLDLLARFRESYPDTIVGMKDSSGDFENMKAAAQNFPGFEVYTGSDEFLVPLMRAGGAGCITAAANICCSVSAHAFANRDNAEGDKAQDILTNVRKVTTSVPPVAGLKEMMARHTGSAGWRNMRPPWMPLDSATAEDYVSRLGATGLELPKAA